MKMDFDLDENKLMSFAEHLIELDKRKRVLPSSEKVKRAEEDALKVMRVLLKRVSKLDDRFKTKLLKSGSYYDGTKVGQPDEFDFMAEMTELSQPGICEFKPTKDNGFIHICLNDASKKSKKRWRDFLVTLCDHLKRECKECSSSPNAFRKENEIIAPDKLQHCFSDLVYKVLKDKKFPLPDGWKHGGNCRPHFSGTRRHGPAVMLQFVIVDYEEGKELKLTLDVSVCVKIQDVRKYRPFIIPLQRLSSTHPTYNLISDGLSSHGLHAIPLYSKMLVKTGRFDNKNAWRISTSKLEKHLLNQWPVNSVPKQCFRLLKYYRDKYLTEEKRPTKRKNESSGNRGSRYWRSGRGRRSRGKYRPREHGNRSYDASEVPQPQEFPSDDNEDKIGATSEIRDSPSFACKYRGRRGCREKQRSRRGIAIEQTANGYDAIDGQATADYPPNRRDANEDQTRPSGMEKRGPWGLQPQSSTSVGHLIGYFTHLKCLLFSLISVPGPYLSFVVYKLRAWIWASPNDFTPITFPEGQTSNTQATAVPCNAGDQSEWETDDSSSDSSIEDDEGLCNDSATTYTRRISGFSLSVETTPEHGDHDFAVPGSCMGGCRSDCETPPTFEKMEAVGLKTKNVENEKGPALHSLTDTAETDENPATDLDDTRSLEDARKLRKRMRPFWAMDVDTLTCKPGTGEYYGPSSYVSSIEIKTMMLILLESTSTDKSFWRPHIIPNLLISVLDFFATTLQTPDEYMKNYFFDTMVTSPTDEEKRKKARDALENLLTVMKKKIGKIS